MRKIIFASNNKHKAEEIRSVLNDQWEIVTLVEAGLLIDIPEPHLTLEANATEKSSTIFKLTKQDCFSEDTGLEVEALNGEPGVRSARYAGESVSFEKNLDKLLLNMTGQKNRKAQFRTVISLILHGTEHQFEGICPGTIIDAPRGKSGFGYDPVFIPEGDVRTFAEMSTDEKNKYSHRRKATDQLIQFLKDNL